MAKFDPKSFATITVPADDPRPASRHSAIEHVAGDIYMVRGAMHSTSSRPWFERTFQRFSRTMTIVRRPDGAGGHDLTLINTIRLNEAGLEALQQLGRIANIVRLGSFHGVDDAFYVNTFGATYWVVEGMKHAPRFTGSAEIMAPDHLPNADALWFEFANIRFPEAVLILPATEERAGVAITVDSIQNHVTARDPDNSWLVQFAISKIGLKGVARLGPIWMRDQVAYSDAAEAGEASKRAEMIACLRPQFEALIRDFEFDMLMPGHGWALMSEARERIAESIEDQLG